MFVSRRRRLLSCSLVFMAIGCRSGAERPAPTGEKPSAVVSVNAPSAPLASPAEGRRPQTTPSAEGRAVLADANLGDVARVLAQRFIIVDGHIDVPARLEESRDQKGGLTEDVSARTPKGDFDWPRAKAGGLDAPFMSIYVPARYEQGGAKKYAEKLIVMVEGFVEKNPEKFAFARSPEDVRKNAAAGKLSLPMGMENGSPLERQLTNVKYFHERGIRYITLAHSKDNHISDSSYDDRHTHKGLSEFGKQVVAEMNRVGIMIDVSHVSDDAFWQVMKESKVPVIASHSSCRHFTPGWARNMSDDMIRALGKQGGVIQINFGSGFIDGQIQQKNTAFFRRVGEEVKKRKLKEGSKEAKALRDELEKAEPKRFASVEQVADHVDHAVKLAGIDHVGLGSDFDGVGDSLPDGLKDVSQYPNLIRVLLARGYKESDIEKICGTNVLRVWQAVDDFAKRAPAQ